MHGCGFRSLRGFRGFRVGGFRGLGFSVWGFSGLRFSVWGFSGSAF